MEGRKRTVWYVVCEDRVEGQADIVFDTAYWFLFTVKLGWLYGVYNPDVFSYTVSTQCHVSKFMR